MSSTYWFTFALWTRREVYELDCGKKCLAREFEDLDRCVFRSERHIQLENSKTWTCDRGKFIRRRCSRYGSLLMHSSFAVSVLLLGRFLASVFSILSCFPSFSLIPHTTLLSETHLT